MFPIVDVSKFYYKRNGGFWLSVNRLFWPKRVEIQMKAFSKMPNEKLIIVGSYEHAEGFKRYLNYLMKIKPKNVELVSWISEKEVIDLYANCRGFITTAKSEDFGYTAVEAIASGKPVIAPNEGGYKENVINGVTGRLITDINEEKLIKAVTEIGPNAKKFKQACLLQSRKFSKETFICEINIIMEDIVNGKNKT